MCIYSRGTHCRHQVDRKGFKKIKQEKKLLLKKYKFYLFAFFKIFYKGLFM